MKKWEYVTIPLLIHNTKAILDTWGDDGWEAGPGHSWTLKPGEPGGISEARKAVAAAPFWFGFAAAAVAAAAPAVAAPASAGGVGFGGFEVLGRFRGLRWVVTALVTGRRGEDPSLRVWARKSSNKNRWSPPT